MHLVSSAVHVILLGLTALAGGNAPAAVTGSYQSNWSEVRLEQHGMHVTDTYVCCGGGTLEGEITGRALHFRWHEPRGAGDGRGVWTIDGDRLDGTWGHGSSESDGGPWTLQRTASQIAQ